MYECMYLYAFLAAMGLPIASTGAIDHLERGVSLILSGDGEEPWRELDCLHH